MWLGHPLEKPSGKVRTVTMKQNVKYPQTPGLVLADTCRPYSTVFVYMYYEYVYKYIGCKHMVGLLEQILAADGALSCVHMLANVVFYP